MKTMKFNKRLIGAVACATAFFVGTTPITAFAHTGPEAECNCESKCSDDSKNENWMGFGKHKCDRYGATSRGCRRGGNRGSWPHPRTVV